MADDGGGVILDPYQCIAKRNRKYASECTEVHLSKRGGEALSENFSHFTSLEVVWLNGNRIARLENLDSNFRIKELYVEDNRLVSLAALKPFKFLRVLLASNNQIRNLEKQLALLTRFNFLKKLDLFGNPVAEEPDYRMRVIYNVKQVEYLDRMAVKGPEREKADEVVPNLDKVSAPQVEGRRKRHELSLLEQKCFNEARQVRERRLRGEFEIILEKTGARAHFGLHVVSNGRALIVDRLEEEGIVDRWNRAAVPGRELMVGDAILEINGGGRGDAQELQKRLASSPFTLKLIVQREDATSGGHGVPVRDLSGAQMEHPKIRLTRPSTWERTELKPLIEKFAGKADLDREDVFLLVQRLIRDGIQEVGRCLSSSTSLPAAPRVGSKGTAAGSRAGSRHNSKAVSTAARSVDDQTKTSEPQSRPSTSRSSHTATSSGAAAVETCLGHPLERILLDSEETMPVSEVADWLLSLEWPFHDPVQLENHICDHYDDASRITPPPLGQGPTRGWDGWAAVHAAARAEGIKTRRQGLPGLLSEDTEKNLVKKTRGDVLKHSLHQEYDEETGKMKLVMPKQARFTAIGG